MSKEEKDFNLCPPKKTVLNTVESEIRAMIRLNMEKHREYIEKGTDQYYKSRYKPALRHFINAYAIFESQHCLYMIGLCAYRGRQHDYAYESFMHLINQFDSSKMQCKNVNTKWLYVQSCIIASQIHSKKNPSFSIQLLEKALRFARKKNIKDDIKTRIKNIKIDQ